MQEKLAPLIPFKKAPQHSLFSQDQIKRLAHSFGLRPGMSILDVGCGSGEPISEYFIDQGHHLTGVDIAPAMIEIAAKRFPDHTWQVADMRHLDLGQTFDGLIGWHSFFHLTRNEQRACLPRLAEHLSPGGVMMVTVGPEDGEVTGHVAGDLVYHASLAPTEYHRILTDLNLDILAFEADDAKTDHASILLARKPR